jgi:uncharacterized lipoprotein YmbA
MKSGLCLPGIVFTAVISTLLTGCLFRPATVSTRHFVLTPISTNESASAATEQLSVGVGFVKMPAYLLRNSLAVRNGANEIEYLEDARWAERLDQCFQRTVAANLSCLLPSDSVHLSNGGRDQVSLSVFINVQQFDVDTGGQGTLIAQWRISAPDSETRLKSGHARLVCTGASPRDRPEVVATTLSNLAAEFSRELVQSIHKFATSSP